MYKWEKLTAGEVGGLLSGRNPREYVWGMFSKDEFSGSFFWFESQEEMLAFIARGLLVNTEVDEEEEEDREYREARKKLKLIAKKIKPGSRLTQSLLEEINEVLAGYAVIEWWGKFPDLREGKGEFAECLLEGWDYGEGETKRVPGDKVDEFIEYLHDYGA
jgi:hypothetical protein